MIFKSLKEKAIDNIIRKELGRSVVPERSTKKGMATLAIIINYDKLSDYKPLMNLASALGVDNDRVFILGFVEKVHKNVNYLIPVFSEDSVKTSGALRSGDVQDFLAREYDLLVNYYTDPSKVMHLMSVLTKASFKVGITGEDTEINDLTLIFEEGNIRGFQEELVKYLKILNKL